MQNFNLKMCLKMHTSCKTNVVLDPKLNVNSDPDSKVVLVPHPWLQTRWDIKCTLSVFEKYEKVSKVWMYIIVKD